MPHEKDRKPFDARSKISHDAVSRSRNKKSHPVSSTPVKAVGPAEGMESLKIELHYGTNDKTPPKRCINLARPSQEEKKNVRQSDESKPGSKNVKSSRDGDGSRDDLNKSHISISDTSTESCNTGDSDVNTSLKKQQGDVRPKSSNSFGINGHNDRPNVRSETLHVNGSSREIQRSKNQNTNGSTRKSSESVRSSERSPKEKRRSLVKDNKKVSRSRSRSSHRSSSSKDASRSKSRLSGSNKVHNGSNRWNGSRKGDSPRYTEHNHKTDHNSHKSKDSHADSKSGRPLNGCPANTSANRFPLHSDFTRGSHRRSPAAYDNTLRRSRSSSPPPRKYTPVKVIDTN